MDIILSIRKIKIIVVTSCLVMFAVPALTQTVVKVPEFSGAYAGKLIWSDTVTMTGDVLILPGASLTIKAGTQVNIVPAEGTKIDPEYLSSQTELLVRGKLSVSGTADLPVHFVIIDNNETEEIAWSGITLDHAAESQIKHAVINRADIAIRTVNSSPEISGNQISDCRYGIIAQQKSHPYLLKNRLTNGESGIFCWRGSNPYLHENQIIGHDEEAVFVDSSSRPKLVKNTIRNNAIGLALYPRNLEFDSSLVTGNGENVRWLGCQGQEDGK